MDGAGTPLEERRLVTVLFADIAGFTPLAERLDPEQLLEVMDPILGAMAAVVVRYDGQVDKFAGDAMLAFFGVPVAHDDDAIRAVLAAQEIQRDVATVLESLPPVARDLALHIGVNTGHVVTGTRPGGTADYSLMGDAVNVAQRLESVAPAGEIYVGHGTYGLTRHRFAFDRVGELMLKGKAAPVVAWRLVADGAAGRAAATPGLAATPFVGRHAEREVLRAAVARVALGAATTVGLVGEPGVGKTRLLEETQRLAKAQEVQWLQTRCLSYGAGLPYWPYAELLRQLAKIQPDEPAEASARKISDIAVAAGEPDAAAYLQHLAGVDSGIDIPPGIRSNPEAMRHNLHRAVGSCIAGLAARAPVILAIEDLHWIDRASLELTVELAQSSRDLPLAFALTARPEGRPSMEEVSAAVGGTGEHIELGHLDVQAASQLVEDMLGPRATPQLIDLVIDRAGGNPLFVREIVRSLLDTDVAASTTGDTGDPRAQLRDVPSTLESVLGARIDLLPRLAGEVLQAAAVVGRQVPVSLLRQLIDDDAVSMIPLLVDRGLLVQEAAATEPSYVFPHAVVVDVAYNRMLRRRRRELHRRLVDAITALFGSGDDVIDLLAHHAYRGEMGDAGLTLVRRAAARAASLFANAEAADYLRNALEMAKADPGAAADVPEILLAAARIHELTGSFPYARELFDSAREEGAGLHAWLGRARTLALMGDYAEASATLEEAATQVTPLSTSDRGLLNAARGALLMSGGSFDRALTVLSTAVSELGDSDDDAKAAVLLDIARVTALTSPAAAIERARPAVALAESRNDLARLATGLRILGGTPQQTGDIDGAAAALDRALAIAQAIGHAEEQGAVQLNLGRVRAAQGRLDEAVARYEGAREVFTRFGIKRGIAAAYCNLAEALLEVHRLDDAARAAAEGLAVAEEIGHQYWIAGAVIGLGLAALQREDWTAAEAFAHRAVKISEELGDPDRISTSRDLLRAVDLRRTTMGDPDPADA